MSLHRRDLIIGTLAAPFVLPSSVRGRPDGKIYDLVVAGAGAAGLTAACLAAEYGLRRILVLESEDSLKKLKDCTPYHFHAPLALLVCYDREASWKRSFDNCDMGAVDAAIVTTQMMLEAASLGLGTTWVGYFDPAEVRKAYELPDYLIPVAILPVGYPAADAAPAPFHEKRLAPEETIFYNSFDGIKPGCRDCGAH